MEWWTYIFFFELLLAGNRQYPFVHTSLAPEMFVFLKIKIFWLLGFYFSLVCGSQHFIHFPDSCTVKACPLIILCIPDLSNRTWMVLHIFAFERDFPWIMEFCMILNPKRLPIKYLSISPCSGTTLVWKLLQNILGQARIKYLLVVTLFMLPKNICKLEYVLSKTSFWESFCSIADFGYFLAVLYILG